MADSNLLKFSFIPKIFKGYLKDEEFSKCMTAVSLKPKIFSTSRIQGT